MLSSTLPLLEFLGSSWGLAAGRTGRTDFFMGAGRTDRTGRTNFRIFFMGLAALAALHLAAGRTLSGRTLLAAGRTGRTPSGRTSLAALHLAAPTKNRVL